MVLDLKRLFVNDDTSLPIEYQLDMSSVDFAGRFPLKKPVKIVGSVFSKASVVGIKADICFVYDAPCDRCGKDTAVSHTVVIDKVLAPSIEGEDSDSIILVPDMKLDVDGLIYSEVVVNLPMKHLCKDDCEGICPKCGKDLNEGDCGCPAKEIDPRLQALADLLKD